MQIVNQYTNADAGCEYGIDANPDADAYSERDKHLWYGSKVNEPCFVDDANCALDLLSSHEVAEIRRDGSVPETLCMDPCFVIRLTRNVLAGKQLLTLYDWDPIMYKMCNYPMPRKHRPSRRDEAVQAKCKEKRLKTSLENIKQFNRTRKQRCQPSLTQKQVMQKYGQHFVDDTYSW